MLIFFFSFLRGFIQCLSCIRSVTTEDQDHAWANWEWLGGNTKIGTQDWQDIKLLQRHTADGLMQTLILTVEWKHMHKTGLYNDTTRWDLLITIPDYLHILTLNLLPKIRESVTTLVSACIGVIASCLNFTDEMGMAETPAPLNPTRVY